MPSKPKDNEPVIAPGSDSPLLVNGKMRNPAGTAGAPKGHDSFPIMASHMIPETWDRGEKRIMWAR